MLCFAVLHRICVAVLGLSTLTACGLFEELPEGGGGSAAIKSLSFRAFNGDVVWSEAVDGEEHALDVDDFIPIDGLIEVEFKKAVDFELARRNITLEELDGPLVGIDLRKSDERIVVEPTEELQRDTWHVLFIDEGIETEGGKKLEQQLRVEFETE